MTNKNISTESTFIYHGDTSLASLGISRIQPKKIGQTLKGLSFSLQNLRNPFPQTLPLKFPKKRIIRGGKSHMLEESIQPIHKPCIRPFQTRNKHNIEVPTKQGIRITHKTNQTSHDNNIYHVEYRSTSNSISVKQSLQKRSKRIFQHMVVKESIKDPILIGQIYEGSVSKGKRHFQNSNQRKNHGEGTKSSLDWKISKSDQKIKFNDKCNAVPQLNFTSLNFSQNKSRTERKMQKNTEINTQRITQRKVQQITNRIPQKTERKGPGTSRRDQKPKTYMQMFNSRRIGLK